MRAEKSNISVYSFLPKVNTVSRRTNVVDLLKKNRAEEKKEKKQRIFILSGFVGSILLFGIVIYL